MSERGVYSIPLIDWMWPLAAASHEGQPRSGVHAVAVFLLSGFTLLARRACGLQRGGGLRDWGRDGLGTGRGKEREGAEAVDVDYAPLSRVNTDMPSAPTIGTRRSQAE